MTSADDLHILSLRNILGLGAVIVAVLIPVGLKRVFRKDLGDLGEAEAVLEEETINTREVDIPAIGDVQPRRYQAVDSGVVLAGPSTGDPNLDIGAKVNKGKGRAVEIIANIREDDEGEYQVYDADQPRGKADRSSILSSKKSWSIKGYGAIDLEDRELVQTMEPWWHLSR